jgi:hypothetical protein
MFRNLTIGERLAVDLVATAPRVLIAKTGADDERTEF